MTYSDPDVPSNNNVSVLSITSIQLLCIMQTTLKTADCSVEPIDKATRTRSRAHIYSVQMLMQGSGYPLYMPMPSRGLPMAYRKHGMRIGDVGVITANGAFDFLFNVCEHNTPPGAGVNPTKLPNGFELLTDIPEILSYETFEPGARLTSKSVNEIRDNGL